MKLQLASLLSLLALLPLAPPAGAATSGAKSARPAKTAAASHHVVPFIADDLDRALADARKTNRPIFVESWAPW
ncbi:MAG: hypothetical protein ABIP29_03505 [Candidatus Eisenbacteria bacterium]